MLHKSQAVQQLRRGYNFLHKVLAMKNKRGFQGNPGVSTNVVDLVEFFF